MASTLLPARFVERPNRFIVIARLPGGTHVEAHLADPGRLRELLVPGAELRLRCADSPATRRTDHTVTQVRSPVPPRAWVSVDTMRANRLAERLLREGRVRGIGRGWDVRREVRREGSRFDFELRRDGRVMLVEVKSVTLVEDGVGLFPDAPTARGVRHVIELTRHVRGGGEATILFVIQRGDAACVRPHRLIDPAFADALAHARAAGVLLRAAAFAIDGGGDAKHLGSRQVRLPRPDRY